MKIKIDSSKFTKRNMHKKHMDDRCKPKKFKVRKNELKEKSFEQELEEYLKDV